MYATTRLLGFESVSSSVFGAQAGQGSLNPTPEIQKLLDAASKLPIPEQKVALEKALEAALAARDNQGVRFVARSIQEWFPKSTNPKAAVPYFEGLLTRAKASGDRNFEAVAAVNLGILATDQGLNDRGLEAYGIALDAYRSISDKSAMARVLTNIAFTHEDHGNLDMALSLYSESLTIYRELGDRSGIADGLNNLANIHKSRGDLDKALSLYSESLTINREFGDKAGIADSLDNLANIHSDRGNLGKALSLYSESLTIYRELGDKSGMAGLLNNIAIIQSRRGDLDKALSMCTESLAIFRDLGDRSGIAASLNNIASVHYSRGDLDKSLALHKESLAIEREIGDKAGIAMSLINVAGIYQSRGDCDRALSICTESLAIERELGDKSGIALRLSNIAGIHLTRVAYREALSALTESESLSRAGGFKDTLAWNRVVHAELLFALGRPDRAGASLAEAGKLFGELGDPRGQSLVSVREGYSLLSSGKPAAALAAFTKARDLRAKATLSPGGIDYLIGEAHLASENRSEGMRLLAPALDHVRRTGIGNTRALTVLGRAYLADDKPGLAKEPLRYALMSAERERDHEDRAHAYAALAEHALAVKDADVAVVHLKRAVESRQSQRRGAADLAEDFRSAISLKVAPDYQKLVSLLTDSGRLGEAVEVAELLKRSEERTQGDFDAVPPARSGTVSAAEDAYRAAAEEIGRLGDRERFLAKVKYPSDTVKAEMAGMPARLWAANQALSSALDQVLAQEKAAGSAASRARDTGAAQARLSSALKGLGAGTAAVTVLCLPEGVRFLVSTASSLTLRKVDVREKTLSAKVKAFRDLLLDPRSDPVPVARALYALLWAPLELELRRLGVQRVLLSLTGSVRYVPFGALHDGKGYLAERWELGLFSPTALERLSSRPSLRWSVLAAGCGLERTVDDGIGANLQFPALPGVRSELLRVRSAVGSGPSPLVDEGFTLGSLMSGLSAKPTVVHLASHFHFDARGESLSFLLTGKGEVLRASDTTVLTKDAFKGVDLLTLSACQTGMASETADGMEVEGIASLLQRKGASTVLSTLWPVADASTAAFMGTFYTLRSQDPRRTKAWCLREAQLRMIRGEVAPPGAPKPGKTRSVTPVKVVSRGLRKDWSHPYHWAPFILQGNPL